MRKRFTIATSVLAAACTALAACGSSGGGTAQPAGAAGGQSSSSNVIKIGYLTDLTGPSASGFQSSEKGVQAYLNAINAQGGVNGQKIEYVMADTASSPTGALTAAEKLVQQDHVFAIAENSSYFFGAEPWLLTQHVPVVGSAIDGPLWTDPKNTNTFPATGPTNAEYMTVGQGNFMKAVGVTKCGSLGYAGQQSSQDAATGLTKACQAVGLGTGYLNTQLPIGSTDIGPAALGIKNSHTDGFYLPTVPSTAFALVGALHQMGTPMKAVLVPNGYGGDLLESKAGVQAAQGVYFLTIQVPQEANTAATNRQKAELAKVGVTGPPTFAEQEAYLTLSLFVTGLKAAGPDPSQEEYIKALRGVKNYDANGLLVPNKIDFSDYTPQIRCMWIVQLKGESFHIVKGDPFCGPVKKWKT